MKKKHKEAHRVKLFWGPWHGRQCVYVWLIYRILFDVFFFDYFF